jgi:uncharacterized membrane protein YeiH
LSFPSIIEILGTVAFTVSGAFSAMQKKLDWFGVLSISFVTAIGGGTLRDVLIGNTPVTWMRDMTMPITILIAGLISIGFDRYIKNLKVTLFLFDTLGLGLFTVIGIQKGLAVGLNPAICVALGTITGCFGGVLRDMLLNHIPVLFRKEIYATACIVGGIVYSLAIMVLPEKMAEIIAIIIICTIRILAVRLKWKLPAVSTDE